MTTINKAEIQKFSNLADEWWNVNGKFKPLHMFNPIRIEYIKEKIINHFNLFYPKTSAIDFLSKSFIIDENKIIDEEIKTCKLCESIIVNSKLSYDIFYIANYSFWLDLSIFFKTLRLIFNAIGSKANITF